MRIEQVQAHAFGPFVDKVLDLAPGMTVVCGPNEAGKSSWHAALYAAICGVRRAKGAPKKEDADFAIRHRPWESDQWDVSATVCLENRRRVLLHHDLAGRVDCSATDADLGREYSGEIMEEGAPNAAVWLGFDRRAFQNTACVGQSDIQHVLQNADALQVHLQRAAASAGGDATAAAALEALGNFRTEHVGTERANSRKPLRSARLALAEAESARVQAFDAHAKYLRGVERVEELAAVADRASLARKLFDAKVARLAVDSARATHERARDLAYQHPEEPPAAIEDGELAERVATALDAWRRRPSPEELSGPTADDLQTELEALPLPPQGETEPAAEVVDAKQSLDRAAAVLEEHESHKPPTPEPVDAGGLVPGDLRRLADVLSTSEPPYDDAVDVRVREAEQALEAASELRLPLVLVSAALLLAAALTLAFGLILAGVVLVLLAAGAFAFMIYVRRPSVRTAAAVRVRQAQEEAATQRAVRVAHAEMTREARRNVEAQGLVAEPDGLRGIAARVEEFERRRADGERWRHRRAELQQAERDAGAALGAALSRRGAAGADAAAAIAQYEELCRVRRAQADEAARRPLLEREIAGRRQLEEASRAQMAAQNQAQDQLAAAAAAAGAGGSTTDQFVANLEAWQAQREAATREREHDRQSWYELQSLLNGGTVQDLETAARNQATRATELADGLDPRAIAATTVADDAAAQSSDIHEEERGSAAALANEQGALENFRRTMPSVPEAEERVASCASELDRVRSLDEVLRATEQFLAQAQDTAHRDIAPILRDTLRPWFPRVTAGRYQDVMVDPATLAVRVRSARGSWRDARLLSHGTAEQIYLLLRVAMAKHLTAPKEVCPLILDDVTVQCDSVRRAAMLNLLRTLSRDRQVVLFSQEAEVLTWARENLTGPKHRVIELDAGEIAP